jgi:hypothetical protein
LAGGGGGLAQCTMGGKCSGLPAPGEVAQFATGRQRIRCVAPPEGGEFIADELAAYSILGLASRRMFSRRQWCG